MPFSGAPAGEVCAASPVKAKPEAIRQDNRAKLHRAQQNSASKKELAGTHVFFKRKKNDVYLHTHGKLQSG
jgi:hypothetical protein